MCVFGDTELLIQILTTLIPNSRVSFLTHAGDLESFFLFFFFPYPPCQQGGCEGNLGTCWCRTADETWIGERFKGLPLPGLSLPDALLASEFVNTFWMQVYTLG